MTMARKAVLVLVVAALALSFVSAAAPRARAASNSISLYGSVSGGWGTSASSESNPGPRLTVAQGDTVTITLHSTDGVQHEFLLDYNGNGKADAGEPVSSAFSTTTNLTFVASQAGTFTYYCLFHPSYMKGTFVVTSSTTTGPSGSGSPGGNTLLFVGIGIVAIVAIGVAAFVLRGRSKQP